MKPSRVFGLGLLGLVAATASVFAEPVDGSESPLPIAPRRVYLPHTPPIDSTVPLIGAPALPAGSSPTNILYLNKCTGGCKVKISNSGTTDNRTDTWGANGAKPGTLTAFPRDATHWAQVMNCVKTTFAPFNVQITDVDPGNTSHYEVMVGGDACAILTDDNCDQIGGIALSCTAGPSCPAYEPNSLVFDFANAWASAPAAEADNEDCATIAQEIAHTWGLDHVVDKTDPMTYNFYNGQHFYHDGEKCGSDCGYANAQGTGPLYSPLGGTCTGSSPSTATHTCFGSGTATQDEVKTLTKLFGSSAPDNVPPTIKISAPAENASVMPKFLVQTTVNDNQGIEKVEFSIDGAAAVAVSAFPYTWTTPATLSMGNHTVTATAYDIMGNMTSASVDVHYGDPCTNPSDCPNTTDTCVAGRCIAGMGAPGGLGTACTNGGQCDSMQCASDGTQSVCVTNCDTSMNGCPTGFGCVSTGATGNAGVCFPGADSGGGGCSSSGSGGSLAFLGIGLGLATLTFRKRTSRT